LDFIIVPALTYDREGYRLGVGGGYYDRFLLRTNAFTAGVARERIMRDMLIHEAHDIPVKCVVTEKNAARFR
jgi:5-formyltetrahydrofolate cyclo-ligase